MRRERLVESKYSSLFEAMGMEKDLGFVCQCCHPPSRISEIGREKKPFVSSRQGFWPRSLPLAAADALPGSAITLNPPEGLQIVRREINFDTLDTSLGLRLILFLLSNAVP
jgi:hypothetical protein